MRSAFLSLALLLASFGLTRGAAAEVELSRAAGALTREANYSWRTEQKYGGDAKDWKVGPTRGRARKDGLSHIVFQMGETPIQAYMHSNHVVMKAESGWLPGNKIEGRQAWLARRLKFYDPPAVELTNLLAKAESVKKDASGYFEARLTSEGVKDLYHQWGGRRSNAPQSDQANGWLKVWLQDGKVQRYEYFTSAVLKPAGDRPVMTVDRTMKVTLQKVGSTRLTPPRAVREALK